MVDFQTFSAVTVTGFSFQLHSAQAFFTLQLGLWELLPPAKLLDLLKPGTFPGLGVDPQHLPHLSQTHLLFQVKVFISSILLPAQSPGAADTSAEGMASISWFPL